MEVCDAEDNDCDSKTDEDEAVGCKVYFPDNDGDNFGIGDGICLCESPGTAHAAVGGDCNDIVTDINPSKPEVCDDVDNNCNGETDESGSAGCEVFYRDKDADGFGDPDDTACLCPSKKSSDWIENGGDCDDSDYNVKPGLPEKCNGGIDDNCNGKTDEVNAEGCQLWFIDSDGDGYGPSDQGKCLCAATVLHKVQKSGDCNDTNDKIHPTVKEVCNGIDEDCNGTTDDGQAVESCPPVAMGNPACEQGKCTAGKCKSGFYDVDGDYGNGCECQADQWHGKQGGACEAAIDVGAFGEGGSKDIKSGNVTPDEGGDWYKFNAVDSGDTPLAGQGICDNFHVRARFLINPNNQFRLDLYRGSCAGVANICTGATDSSWTVKFYGKPYGPATAMGVAKGKVVPSPDPLPAGECKCAGGEGLPGMNTCSDNSAWYFVRVFRAPGVAPTCDFYQIEISNGTYSP
jgi:hypothetical protein